MAIYAVGDIQGCYDALRRLLDHVGFDPKIDQLWLAGDLVNRGPHSLETLRFVKGLADAAVTVLGNHDLHLIATALTLGKIGKKDTLLPILKAPDCDELIAWLRHRPLFHRNDHFCLLHAGLPPQWDLALTQDMASLVERALQGPEHLRFFASMYGNKPALWSDTMTRAEKLRFAVNCFTRLRYCDADGTIDFAHKGPPGSQPPHLMPWFTVPNRKSRDLRIIFGHWSTLGFYDRDNVYAIDTGCLWGGQLTALMLGDDVQRYSMDCACTPA
ncbi:MAG: symmetrical bis(5'-nucleosyl)-tetraphosphatase [Methylomonas sp.]|nr:symmetrical bis(5'-nucleosyl)-tetraphosphatase [Methylomonas sp.]PPD22580.1 MAG: diadenosine tetraphosphatase [Methylomonas sp.]PPD27891.1 MAG: diadenosine tetraphosphatase [Methylomonas sp.]PPD38078.1 MAG: diadenosine tetraphosphatase [Methylomonas sp.]PPD40001.1 MAG: diadenosine tetraphosphatase [Methylomonas sp.]